MFKKVLLIIGGMLLSVSLIAAAGLGVWAYKLNSQLAQAQADYQSLKADYGELDSEYGQAKVDFKDQSEQTEADLEKAQAQIKKLEGDLKAAQDENKVLKGKIEGIKSKIAVLNTFWFGTDASFQRKIDSTDDKQLEELYAVFMENDTLESYLDLMSYMIESITEVSGINWGSSSFGYTSVIGQVG